MTLSPWQRFHAFVEDRPFEFVLILTGVITGLRLLLLFFYQTALGPDEAQYWFWGQDLDWGYYSKPPMIAWVIALPTTLFGDHTWAVRFLSPLFIGGSALLLFLSGRHLYGDRVGIWAAVMFLLMPAVMLGATIISTDVPLLFFWCGALFALLKLSDAGAREQTRWAIALGAALGLGFLSKYAMFYFPIGWALAAIFSPTMRQSLRLGTLFKVLLAAAIVFAPNIIWNAQNGFQTVGHTADNADWRGTLNIEELWQFLGDQFGVAGPILFAVLLIGAVRTLLPRRWIAGPRVQADITLLSFTLPPLLIICGQALLSRANANWAIAAYPAAMILIPAWLIRWRARWALWASVGLHAAVGLLVTAGLVHFQLADGLGLSNAVKRLRGWDEQTQQLAQAAASYDTVLVDEREVAAHLVWEWRNRDIAVEAFDLNGRKDNTYEHAFPFAPISGERYLLVTPFPDLPCAYDAFAVRAEQGTSFVDLNATRRGIPERTLFLHTLSGFDASRPTCEG